VATKKKSTNEQIEDWSMEDRVFRGHAPVSDADVFDQQGITLEA
jgi:hypothetical protein